MATKRIRGREKPASRKAARKASPRRAEPMVPARPICNLKPSRGTESDWGFLDALAAGAVGAVAALPPAVELRETLSADAGYKDWWLTSSIPSSPASRRRRTGVRTSRRASRDSRAHHPASASPSTTCSTATFPASCLARGRRGRRPGLRAGYRVTDRRTCLGRWPPWPLGSRRNGAARCTRLSGCGRSVRSRRFAWVCRA